MASEYAEGLQALYETLLELTTEGQNRSQGQARPVRVGAEGLSGQEWLLGQVQGEDLLQQPGSQRALRTGQEGATAEQAGTAFQEWQDGTAAGGIMGLNARGVSRAVELDARRYDGQIGQGR